MTEREWLEADGLGGFAMGAADGIRTRRYHGLLCAALAPPDRRMLLVADLEVYVETAAGRFALSSHRYRGDAVHPDGASRITSFSARPWPRWDYVVPGGTKLTCELVVEPGTAAVVVRWTASAAAKLEVRPLLAARDYHGLQRESPAFSMAADVAGARVTWWPWGVAIHAIANGAYRHEPDWYRNFELVAERERGLDHEEDLATPGVFTFDLAIPAVLAFSTASLSADCAAAFDRERARRGSGRDDACDAFIVTTSRAAVATARTDKGRTIIAGYPWFCDWGRDTFISLRGLCLARDRRDVAREILLEWAPQVSQGMLPNRYTDASKPEYNSVDAALWFVIAADAFARSGATIDADRRALEAAVDAIVDGYTAGTRHRIAATDDGLLACGEPGVQLTWMDAKIGDEVVTPRIGKPVEIQALWLNALAIAGRRRPELRARLERGLTSFGERFWDANRSQLHDVVDVDHVAGIVDTACRPNQLFAVGGLPLPLVGGERAKAIVDTALRKLWTPFGPRSLAPDEPRYRGRYIGGPVERDRSYHNGPVWPWLAGAFVEAWLRVYGSRDEARERFVEPLRARALGGHLCEIYEGDAPHRAVGCPFQAWSIAELVRLERDVVA